jgi:hypothetical protein
MPKTIEDIRKALGWEETPGHGVEQKIRSVIRTLSVPIRSENYAKGHRYVIEDQHAEQLVSLLRTMPAPRERNLTKKVPALNPASPLHPSRQEEHAMPPGPGKPARPPSEPTLPPVLAEVPKMDTIGFKSHTQEFEVTLRKLLHLLKTIPGIESIEIEKSQNGDWTASIVRSVTVTKEEKFNG